MGVLAEAVEANENNQQSSTLVRSHGRRRLAGWEPLCGVAAERDKSERAAGAPRETDFSGYNMMQYGREEAPGCWDREYAG